MIWWYDIMYDVYTQSELKRQVVMTSHKDGQVRLLLNIRGIP